MRVGFTLNQERFVIDVPVGTLLLDVLRNEFSLKSLHGGCHAGHCGSCLVLLGDTAVPACLVPIFACRDRSIETAEGLMASPAFGDIEKGFHKAGLVPCQLCASSKIVLTESLLRCDPEPTPSLIETSIPAHWCACNALDHYIDAVMASLDIRRRRKKHVPGS